MLWFKSFTNISAFSIRNLLNLKDDNDLIIKYFDKYSVFLSKNSLKNFTKDIIDLKF